MAGTWGLAVGRWSTLGLARPHQQRTRPRGGRGSTPTSERGGLVRRKSRRYQSRRRRPQGVALTSPREQHRIGHPRRMRRSVGLLPGCVEPLKQVGRLRPTGSDRDREARFSLYAWLASLTLRPHPQFDEFTRCRGVGSVGEDHDDGGADNLRGGLDDSTGRRAVDVGPWSLVVSGEVATRSSQVSTSRHGGGSCDPPAGARRVARARRPPT